MQRTEVLIVGGGPAGAACAWRLRSRGVDCMILDRQPFLRAKPCAGWITPQVLRDLDLDPADYRGGFTTYHALHISFRGLTFKLPTWQHAIRRWEFDDWLLRRAGVPVHRHKVSAITRAPARAGGCTSWMEPLPPRSWSAPGGRTARIRQPPLALNLPLPGAAPF
jgi:2-polyprenyl-6-methoxyphenol hydroxylase-like FAD-dependent oxidoreductase